jgi:hypothetical protein
MPGWYHILVFLPPGFGVEWLQAAIRLINMADWGLP